MRVHWRSAYVEWENSLSKLASHTFYNELVFKFRTQNEKPKISLEKNKIVP
jgi:hypothetical protein